MINDLELTTVVDVQGILTPLFTDEDNALLDSRIADYNEHLFRTMSMDFFNASFLSQKLAIIDRMKACNDIPVRLAESITGHSSGGSEFNTYGTIGYTLEQKLEVIKKVAV